jgi:hypothetical protein
MDVFFVIRAIHRFKAFPVRLCGCYNGEAQQNFIAAIGR